jgi:hypothetical protein
MSALSGLQRSLMGGEIFMQILISVLHQVQPDLAKFPTSGFDSHTDKFSRLPYGFLFMRARLPKLEYLYQHLSARPKPTFHDESLRL